MTLSSKFYQCNIFFLLLVHNFPSLASFLHIIKRDFPFLEFWHWKWFLSRVNSFQDYREAEEGIPVKVPSCMHCIGLFKNAGMVILQTFSLSILVNSCTKPLVADLLFGLAEIGTFPVLGLWVSSMQNLKNLPSERRALSWEKNVLINGKCSVIHFFQTTQSSSTCKQDEIPSPTPTLLTSLWRIKELNCTEV